MKPSVYIVDQPRYDAEKIRGKARETMERDRFEVKGKSVFVKPSFVYPARPPRNIAVNTQPEVVGGVAHALRDLGASRVWVGEDCLVGPAECGFVAMGVLPYIRGAAEPLFLKHEPRIEVRVDDHIVEDRFMLPRKLMDADLFVSLPKLKVNMYATITLSVKNHIGLLLQNDRLTNHHYNIHKKIADLYRARVPDFIVTDAIMAGEGQGPMHAEPAETGVLIAGRNGLAVDTACCRLMGYDPAEVEHLALLEGKGLGTMDLEEIEVHGKELLIERSRRLSRPRTDFADYDESLRFIVGAETACPEGCVGMIRGTLDRWAQANKWGSLRGFTFITGKPIASIPEGLKKRKTFVVGDCAKEYAHLGKFMPGCPVPPMQLTYELAKKGVNGPLATRVRDLAKGAVMHTLGMKVR